MPYIRSTPAETPLVTDDLADDIVTLAKIASGTDGELITWDASGNPAAVGAGTSGHFLKSQGAGSVPVFAAVTNPITLISDTDISNAASYSFTGFDSSKYDSYEFVFHSVKPATNNVYLHARFSTDGGSSYDNGASDYSWFLINNNADGATGDHDTADTEIALSGDLNSVKAYIGNDTADAGVHGRFELFFPHVTTVRTVAGWTIFGDAGGSSYSNILTGSGMRLTAQDTDGLQFLFSSGNIASGTIKVYGRNVS